MSVLVLGVTRAGDKAIAMEFLEVPCEVLYGDIERVGGEGSQCLLTTEHGCGSALWGMGCAKGSGTRRGPTALSWPHLTA